MSCRKITDHSLTVHRNFHKITDHSLTVHMEFLQEKWAHWYSRTVKSLQKLTHVPESLRVPVKEVTVSQFILQFFQKAMKEVTVSQFILQFFHKMWVRWHPLSGTKLKRPIDTYYTAGREQKWALKSTVYTRKTSARNSQFLQELWSFVNRHLILRIATNELVITSTWIAIPLVFLTKKNAEFNGNSDLLTPTTRCDPIGFFPSRVVAVNKDSFRGSCSNFN